MPNAPIKNVGSLPSFKTSTVPVFKSPVPEKSFSAGEPLRTVLEGQTGKTAQTVPVKTVTKTTTAFTKPGPQTSKFHWDPHAFKKWGDESFWASLATIIAIPILLLMALFDIIVKAAPWATGPS